MAFEQASSRDPRGRTKRVPVKLVCSECQGRNYETTKVAGAHLELKKYCRHCQRHTTHRESK